MNLCVCFCVCPSAVTPSPVIHPLITHQPYHTADPAMVTQPSERATRPCRTQLLKMMQHDGQASCCLKRSESNVFFKSSLLTVQREKSSQIEEEEEEEGVVEHEEDRTYNHVLSAEHSDGTGVHPGCLTPDRGGSQCAGEHTDTPLPLQILKEPF